MNAMMQMRERKIKDIPGPGDRKDRSIYHSLTQVNYILEYKFLLLDTQQGFGLVYVQFETTGYANRDVQWAAGCGPGILHKLIKLGVSEQQQYRLIIVLSDTG